MSQQTTLTSAVTSGATVIPVVSATTLLGGITIAANEVFTVVIDPDTSLEEIVDVTLSSGNPVSANNLTVVRAVDGSSAQSHSAGAIVRHMVIGRDLREPNTHASTSLAVHGIAATSNLVGTIETQTLYNKTLVNPVMTGTSENDSGISFQGATVDAYSTTLSVVDPTANRSIVLPNNSGTVALISDVNAIAGSASAAATSAASAATSATSAAASATAAATSATSAATSASSSLATYNTYKTYYLGSFASAPTLDNQGNALITGATYFNSGSSIMYTYTGSAWIAISISAGVATVNGTAGTITSSGGSNPVLTLATAGTAGTYAYPTSVTTDAYGRVTSITAGSAPSGYTAPILGSTTLTSGATVLTVAGLTKITSTQYTQLDGNGYEMNLFLLNLAGAI